MKTRKIFAPNNPNNQEEGQRTISISKDIFIDKSDFMEKPEKNILDYAPGKEVRLRHAFNITCNEVIKDDKRKHYRDQNVLMIHVSRDMSKGNKVKGMIHWVRCKQLF